MRTHKELVVWQKSIDFVTDIYKMTRNFPKDEVYGLTSQMRRAAVSIPSNIAEGAARCHIKEYLNFLNIALGSASELDTQIIISKNLQYLSAELSDEYSAKLCEISKMLHGIVRSLVK
jgi:four helix bundle protein